MKLTQDELEFLSAWAPRMGAQLLRAARTSPADGSRRGGRHLITFIKIWTKGEHRKDQEIFTAAVNPEPRWPWSTTEDFARRMSEASREATHREVLKESAGVEIR